MEKVNFKLYTKEEYLKIFAGCCPHEQGFDISVCQLDKTLEDKGYEEPKVVEKMWGMEDPIEKFLGVGVMASICDNCWNDAIKDIEFRETQYTNFMQAIDEHEDTCTTIAMEECSELVQAISKAKRGKLDRDNLAEEMADVLISIDWLSEIYDIDYTEIMKWKSEKEKRVVDRLNSGDFN